MSDRARTTLSVRELLQARLRQVDDALDFTLVLTLRGLTVAEYFQDRDPVSGTVYYLMLGVFAIMPLLVARNRHIGL